MLTKETLTGSRENADTLGERLPVRTCPLLASLLSRDSGYYCLARS